MMESIFDSWEIRDLIGKGNFGAVYEIGNNNEKAAMKVVNIYPQNSDFNEILGTDNHAELEEKTSEVMKEIDMLYHLKGNTHIVNYLDHYVDKKDDVYSLYLRMEYLQRLDDYYGEEIESSKALSITYDILDALTICEENQIVHGDIKPQNIMVDDHGNNKLTDFGISKVMSGKKVNNYTPAYAPPEVITDRKYTKQSDLYSLGLVIYQIYNNNLLPFMNKGFQKKDTSKIIDSRLKKDVPEPANGSKELNSFLAKALNRNPEDRFKTAKEMKDELQNLDKNNLLPKVLVVLPIMMSIAIKFNTFSVFGSEIARQTVKETAKHSLVDSITSMTLTTKVIIGTVATLVIGGGVIVGIDKASGNKSAVIEKQGTLILELGDTVKNIASQGAKVSFSNPDISYDNGIKTKIKTISEVSRGNADVSINSDTAIIDYYEDTRDNYIETVSLKTQERINYEENLGTPSIGPEDEIDNSELAVRIRNISSAGLECSPTINLISNKNQWELTLEGVDAYDASIDEKKHHLFVTAGKGATIKSSINLITFDDSGDYIINVDEDGTVSSQIMKSDLNTLQKDELSFFEGYTFSGEETDENYLGNKNKYIYDDKGKMIKKIEFDEKSRNRVTRVSEVFRIDENTLGYYYSFEYNEGKYNKRGTLLHKILLTDILIDENGKKTTQKAMVFPDDIEIKKSENTLETMLSMGVCDTTYYSQFLFYVPFLSAYAGSTDKAGKTIGKDDFKTELAQRYFLSSAARVMEIEGQIASNSDDTYKLKTEECVKVVRKYLGVEPAFDTSKEYYEFKGVERLLFDRVDVGGYVNSYFSDTLYKCDYKTEGEFTTISFYRPFMLDNPVCTIKIKGSVHTYDFTFESASNVFVE